MVETVRLDEICDVAAGQGAPQGDDQYSETEGVPFIKAGNLEYLSFGGNVTNIQKVNSEVAVRHHLQLFKKGSIVFAKSGMSCMKGHVYVLDIDCYVVNHLACLTPKNENLQSLYLKYYFQAHPPNLLVKNDSYPSIKLSDIRNLPIPMLRKNEQKKILEKINKLDNLTQKRKKQLEILDTAEKSLFVEMFGDPVENPMGWEFVPLSSICEKILGGGTPSKSHPEYYTGTIPWVTPKDMKSIVIKDSINHITTEAIENSATKLIPPNSVLIVIRSGILKHTLPLSMNKCSVTINQDMKAFIPNLKSESWFILYFLKTIEKKLLYKVKAMTVDNIDFNIIKKHPVPLPPLPLQHTFAARIEKIEQQKTNIKTALDNLETIRKAMMQEYFG